MPLTSSRIPLCQCRGGRHPGTLCCVCSLPLRHSVCVRDIATLLWSPQRVGAFKTKLLLEASTLSTRSSELLLKKRPATYFQLGGRLPPSTQFPSTCAADGNEMYWGCFTLQSCFKHEQVPELPLMNAYVRVNLWQFTLPGLIVWFAPRPSSLGLTLQRSLRCFLSLSFLLFSYSLLPTTLYFHLLFPFLSPRPSSYLLSLHQQPSFFFFFPLFYPAKVWWNFL